MSKQILVARIEPLPDQTDRIQVNAPSVGEIKDMPPVGNYLNPGEVIGTLVIMEREHPLVLPAGIDGQIEEIFTKEDSRGVAYNQPLFRLRQGFLGNDLRFDHPAGQTARKGVSALKGTFSITAPSDGIFYRKPSPESPPYVEEGQQVAAGQVLGLIEVMKSFNQIHYGGPTFPDKSIVEKVKAEDGAEVCYGQELFSLRPVQ